MSDDLFYNRGDEPPKVVYVLVGLAIAGGLIAAGWQLAQAMW